MLFDACRGCTQKEKTIVYLHPQLLPHMQLKQNPGPGSTSRSRYDFMFLLAV
jgi:hypothetical protein